MAVCFSHQAAAVRWRLCSKSVSIHHTGVCEGIELIKLHFYGTNETLVSTLVETVVAAVVKLPIAASSMSNIRSAKLELR